MTEHRQRLRLFFDGGCRPNPGPMEIAVVARGQVYERHDIGTGTNNDAEWLALLYALEIAITLGADDLDLVGDSMLVIQQAKGQWKCRTSVLKIHLAAFNNLASQFTRLTLRHVGRSQNLAGIALARKHARG